MKALTRLLPSTNGRYDDVLSVAAHLIAGDGFRKARARSIAQKARLSQAAANLLF